MRERINLAQKRKTFGVKLKRAMKEQQLSVYDLARRTGISATGIYKYLDGSVMPTPARCAKMAAALSVSAAFLTSPDVCGEAKEYDLTRLMTQRGSFEIFYNLFLDNNQLQDAIMFATSEYSKYRSPGAVAIGAASIRAAVESAMEGLEDMITTCCGKESDDGNISESVEGH